jgi:hypothetical protein
MNATLPSSMPSSIAMALLLATVIISHDKS